MGYVAKRVSNGCLFSGMLRVQVLRPAHPFLVESLLSDRGGPVERWCLWRWTSSLGSGSFGDDGLRSGRGR